MKKPDRPELDYILLVAVLAIPFVLIAIWTIGQWR